MERRVRDEEPCAQCASPCPRCESLRRRRIRVVAAIMTAMLGLVACGGIFSTGRRPWREGGQRNAVATGRGERVLGGGSRGIKRALGASPARQMGEDEAGDLDQMRWEGRPRNSSAADSIEGESDIWRTRTRINRNGLHQGSSSSSRHYSNNSRERGQESPSTLREERSPPRAVAAGGEGPRGRSERRRRPLATGAAGDTKDRCLQRKEQYHVQPHLSWGDLPAKLQRWWQGVGCNQYMSGANEGGSAPIAAAASRPLRKHAPLKRKREQAPQCLDRPSRPSDPLIAVMAGSTTRSMVSPTFASIALFRFLLPSLALTAECGFNYAAVIGYDVGDPFFDSESGTSKVKKWFEENVSDWAAERGISIKLELVQVDNKVKKPGPVFTAIAQRAYALGAEYMYRLNDDTELVSPWAVPFTNALKSMGEPFGVVGPESLNSDIIVHDFTHRRHMDIFEGVYYPPQLSDWWMDDWISRVYGNGRTIRARNIQAVHHTGAHGRRYQVDRSHAKLLGPLVESGHAKILAWMGQQHLPDKALEAFERDKTDGTSAKRPNGRDVRV